jgi:hypothetical protein
MTRHSLGLKAFCLPHAVGRWQRIVRMPDVRLLAFLLTLGCWVTAGQWAAGADAPRVITPQPPNQSIAAAEEATAGLQRPLDAFESLLSGYVTNIEAQLANPQIDRVVRQALERRLSSFRGNLAGHRAENSLWQELALARVSNDSAGVARAQARLADYLAGKLGDIEGRRYPTGMSLASVMDRYNAKLGRGAPLRWGKLFVRTVLIALLVVPPVLIVLQRLRQRRGDVPG